MALFSFLAVNQWSDARRKERESYYKNDMLKKLADSQGPGANFRAGNDAGRGAAVDHPNAAGAADRRAGDGRGWAGGAGLAAGAARTEGVYLCGLIPLLIGMALYGGSFLVKEAESSG